MTKKSTENKTLFFTSPVYTFPLIILLLTLIVFIFFHPGIRPRWDKKYRTVIFENFLKKVNNQNQFDPQAYWLFRERFSPGTFKLNGNAVGFYQTFKIISLEDSELTNLIYYYSPFIKSTDSITKDEMLLDKISENNSEKKLLQTQTVLISTDQNEKFSEFKRINIWFLLPIEYMKLANGLFDYTTDELKLIENSYWFNHTEIML